MPYTICPRRAVEEQACKTAAAVDVLNSRRVNIPFAEAAATRASKAQPGALAPTRSAKAIPRLTRLGFAEQTSHRNQGPPAHR